MGNDKLLKAKVQEKSLLDEVDNIALNTEVIENFNKLMCDKLQEVTNLDHSIGLSQEQYLMKIWEVTRYSECYITLNYAISNEIEKLNKSKDRIYEIFKEVSLLLDSVTTPLINEEVKDNAN